MKQKSKLIIGAIAVVVIFCFGLFGNRLANGDQNQKVNEDQFVGYFCAFGEKNLFPEEIVLTELRADKSVEPRIYATKVYDEKNKVPDYQFVGVEGIPAFAVHVTDEQGEAYEVNGKTDGNPARSYYSSYNVNNNKCEVKYTIYLAVGKDHANIWTYPVYQTADGKVYMTKGNVTGFSGYRKGDSYQVNESYTTNVTINGEVREKIQQDLSVRFEMVVPGEGVNLIMMDKNHQVLDEKSYTCYEYPERIVLSEQTEYILLEEWIGEKRELTERKLYQREDEEICLYTVEKAPMCELVAIQLDWN